MKGCFDRFDMVFALGFTGKPDRVDSLVKKEFPRVGIVDFYRHLQMPTPFDQMLMNAMPFKTKCMSTVPFFNSTFGHYRCIKIGYELGCKSILLCEDDIRFLLDTEKLGEISNDLPDDFDLALFDSIAPGVYRQDPSWYLEKRKTRSSTYWCPFEDMHSAGCYALSRKGMAKVIERFEAVCFNFRKKVLTIDQMFNVQRLGTGLKMYFSNPHGAIQMPMGGCNSSDNSVRKVYDAMGIATSDYGEV